MGGGADKAAGERAGECVGRRGGFGSSAAAGCFLRRDAADSDESVGIVEVRDANASESLRVACRHAGPGAYEFGHSSRQVRNSLDLGTIIGEDA